MNRTTQLDELIKKTLPKRYKLLPGPADARAIAKAQRKAAPEIPSALLELYAWRDGSANLPIFSDYVFLPVGELAQHRKRLMSSFRHYAKILHNAPWIPFLYARDHQQYLCLDTVGSFGGSEGQIILAGLWDDSIQIAFPSLSAWLDAFIALMEDGVKPERPLKSGPTRDAWTRAFAAVRRRLGHRLPRHVNASTEGLRAQVEQNRASAGEILLKEGIKNHGGDMLPAALRLLDARTLPAADGAQVALDIARGLLREAEKEAAKAARRRRAKKEKFTAEEAFEEASDAWEDVVDALITAAGLDPGRAKEAASMLEDAIAAAGTPGERFYLHFKLGYFLDRTGDQAGAIESYKRSVVYFDEMSARIRRGCHNYAHNNLGVIFEQSGRYDEALAMYRRAIAVDPRDAIPRKGLADTLARMGRLEEAIAAYRIAVRGVGSWLGAWTALITCCQQLGLSAEAEKAIARAFTLAEETDNPLEEHACLLAAAGETDAALEALAESIKLDPKLRRIMRHDLDFERLWDDPRFLALVS